MKRTDYIYLKTKAPHRIRRTEILQKYPEIRDLFGKNPNTIWCVMGLVFVQIGIGCLLSGQSWWLIITVAYVLGAFIDHALSVTMHESVHRLIFNSKAANRWAGILSNIPQILPFAAQFDTYHIQHHAFQGIYELDLDLPSRWEAAFFNHHFMGKFLWLLFYPLVQTTRLLRVKRNSKQINGWVLLNWMVQIATIILVEWFFGMKALTYLILSFFFSLGVHPLGGRWIQEHYLTHQAQETYSYYGLLNKLAFNVGYHNEHHDFPSIPWNRLAKIRDIAPEFYMSLAYHSSWVKLLLRFFFDKNISLFSRVVRVRGGDT